MTDLLLVLLINFFALYTTSQYLAVLKKEEQKKTWRCLLPHFLLWCVLNTCCLILIRTKGVLSLFSAAVAAIILLFETIFAFQKEEAWKEKTRRREYMTSRQLQYYAKQYEALSHFQETMRKERHERKNRNMELLMLAKKGDFDSLICRLNEEQSLMTPHSSTTGNRTLKRQWQEKRRLKWRNLFPFQEKWRWQILSYAVFLEMRLTMQLRHATELVRRNVL